MSSSDDHSASSVSSV
jgi:hypothetical protein